MGFKTGIIGLPNVGKSTLFNALTKSKSAQAANFPFCTIDPNIGEVMVPDERLQELSKISLVWVISSWQILENVMRWLMSQDALRMKT